MKMKNKIPQEVWNKVVIGFIFSLFIMWIFAYNVTASYLLPFLPKLPVAYLTFIFSFLACLLLIKRTIEIEMKNLDAPVTIVARNPEIEITQEKLTVRAGVKKIQYSLLFTILLSLPFLIISIIQVASEESSTTELMDSFIESYWVIYFICFLISLFITFVFMPSLKGWHWTKPQF